MLSVNPKIGNLFLRVVSTEPRSLITTLTTNNKWESKYTLFGSYKRLAKQFWKRFEHTTSKMIIKPPESVRGMTELNREAFKIVVQAPFFEINVKHLRSFSKLFKSYFLKLMKFSNIEDTSDAKVKRIILDPDKVCVDGTPAFTSKEKDALKDFDLEVDKLEWKDIMINYENWKQDVIFKSVLPPDIEGSTSYSLIGHIIHLNLREHLSDYRFVIGQVLLDKLQAVSLVVNKSKIIDSTYRNFQMEVIAGEASTVTTVKENGRTFTFDFAEVYWNPRLSTEHERIVKCLKENDVLFDVFAGVGPFAIPAAKKGCKVFANDLNPHSYKWMVVNAEKNKVEKVMKCYNLDGKDFIENVLKSEVTNIWKNCEKELLSCCTCHVAMNLPALALEFLPAFNGLFWNYSNMSEAEISPIKIHVYFFVKNEKKEETEAIAKKFVREKLNLSESVDLEYYFVRIVSNFKYMVRVSFFVPNSVLFNKKTSLSTESNAEFDLDAKRICLEVNKNN